jgi:hypothetical protein
LRALARDPHVRTVAAVTAAFVALTVWWVLVDARLPGGGDPGRHLTSALGFGNLLADLDLVGLFDYRADATSGFFYPPLGRFVAGAPTAVGLDVQDWGVVAVNLVFVPLLAAGCFLVGRRIYGPFAGALAAAFALGTPMILDLFHIFMLDAPLAATVAITIWALLASESFSKRRESVLAGLLGGIAFMVKSTAPVFFVGPIVVMLLRGGWREWRNIGLAALAAIAVAGPWHLAHAGDITNLSGQAPYGVGPGQIVGGGTDRSALGDFLDKLGEYWWVAVNLQYFLPLLILFLVGVVYAVRERRERPQVVELLAGVAFAYLFFAFATTLRDPRYTLPLVVFVAVIATGWIATTRRPALQAGGLALLVAAVLMNAMASATDALPTARVSLPGDDSNFGNRVAPGAVTIIDDEGYIGGPPRRDDFWERLVDSAAAEGAQTIGIEVREAPALGTDRLGLEVLADQAGMTETSYAGSGVDRPDVRIYTWLKPDAYWSGEIGLPEPCARVLDGFPATPMAVAVERRGPDGYERWCDFLE